MADPFHGSIVKNAADSASSNFNNTTLTWDSEEIDTDAIHSTSSNTSRLTIPLALNGRYGVLHVNIELTNVVSGSDGYAYIAKNGSETFDGAALVTQTGYGGVVPFFWITVHTPALLLTTNDFYEVVLFITDTATVLQSENVQFSIEVVGS